MLGKKMSKDSYIMVHTIVMFPRFQRGLVVNRQTGVLRETPAMSLLHAEADLAHCSLTKLCVSGHHLL